MWKGDIARARVEALYGGYRAACAREGLRKELDPGSFPQELGRLLWRYKNGRKEGNRRVKLSNHWTTPEVLIGEGLLKDYNIHFVIQEPLDPEN